MRVAKVTLTTDFLPYEQNFGSEIMNFELPYTGEAQKIFTHLKIHQVGKVVDFVEKLREARAKIIGTEIPRDRIYVKIKFIGDVPIIWRNGKEWKIDKSKDVITNIDYDLFFEYVEEVRRISIHTGPDNEVFNVYVFLTASGFWKSSQRDSAIVRTVEKYGEKTSIRLETVFGSFSFYLNVLYSDVYDLDGNKLPKKIVYISGDNYVNFYNFFQHFGSKIFESELTIDEIYNSKEYEDTIFKADDYKNLKVTPEYTQILLKLKESNSEDSEDSNP